MYLLASVPWDIRVSIDLYLGGIGIGLLIISILLSYINQERYMKITKLSAYAAPILVGIGLLALVTELGKSFRMPITLIYPNFQSVTSWGSYIQTFFMAVAILYAAMIYFKKMEGTLFHAVKIITLILAIAVGGYHGLLLTSIGLPLWGDGALTILFFISSIVGGAALLMAIRSFVLKDNQNEDKNFGMYMNISFFILISTQIFVTFMWVISVNRAGRDTLESYQMMMDEYGILWWIGAILIGLAIPFILSLVQLVKNTKQIMPQGMSLIIALSVVVGSFAMKHIIIEAGQWIVPFHL